ncbi:hypothetical protein Nepgr_025430 [Nepenthes gracilis]|uniref:Uncharacterized protein n=1 Tax=Nepenthes gracilis TaxID=150966 RepID=A0AAD3T6F0_NEPGR|nr:hypothetical protein Nepgr_025430 [Nepenthes gracilis]
MERANERGGSDNLTAPHKHYSSYEHYYTRNKRMKLSHDQRDSSTKCIDYSDPFAVRGLLESVTTGKYGSVTKDVEALLSRKIQLLNSLFALHPKVKCMMPDMIHSLGREASELMNKSLVNLEDVSGTAIVSSAAPVVIIDSDDDDAGEQRPSYPFQEILLQKQAEELLQMSSGVDNSRARKTSKRGETTVSNNLNLKDKGVYLGVDDELVDEGNYETNTEDDCLVDIWKEMTVALECSKDVTVDSFDEHSLEEDEDCDHSYVLRDDLGYVCRVCGVIKKGIESIIEFQYIKSARTRTYRSESRYGKDDMQTGVLPDWVKLSGHDFSAIEEIAAHPRHMKQMKPHQVEGFNFLKNNLLDKANPGGCIIAHAPGSGKTFMIISFMQSFLAKCPEGRPLVILPKSILSTWKKEFQRWQVENIPLFDFYSVKADNRHQQLEVLRQWKEHKSILFLGYKQFSTIVTDNSVTDITAACQEILLKQPTILIMDEGHTPRTEDTDQFHSIAKVQTPLKVVLSGTLYQNHVKEVFNILNLVRPKFLKLETSRSIKKRIMSRVQISGVRKQLKAKGDGAFYELVEYTLQQDEDSRRKEIIIKDLREMTSGVLHYYKGDFLDELPGLVDFTLLLKLSPKQKVEVDKLRRFERTKFKRSSVGSAVYLHPKLKQLSDPNAGTGEKGMQYNDEKVDEIIGKMDIKDGVKAKFFLNILGLCQAASEKLLVFSQYLLPLKFLERLAVHYKGWSVGKEILVLTGDSSSEQRDWSMDRFNNSSESRVLFGSIKACGEGISLIGASRIIILDVHLNPSVSRQAIGRAFRPGQVRKVYAYRLVAADSPEDEDHLTCFKKELIAKSWFEWNEYFGQQDFEMEAVDIKDCGDDFLESPLLTEDIKFLHRR